VPFIAKVLSRTTRGKNTEGDRLFQGHLEKDVEAEDVGEGFVFTSCGEVLTKATNIVELCQPLRMLD